MTDPATEPPPLPYAELWAALDWEKSQVRRLENELAALRSRVSMLMDREAVQRGVINALSVRVRDLETRTQREDLE